MTADGSRGSRGAPYGFCCPSGAGRAPRRLPGRGERGEPPGTESGTPLSRRLGGAAAPPAARVCQLSTRTESSPPHPKAVQPATTTGTVIA